MKYYKLAGICPDTQCLVYLPSIVAEVYGKLVGKHTSLMDPMGYIILHDLNT